MDGVEIDPRAYWGDPTAFIDAPTAAARAQLAAAAHRRRRLLRPRRHRGRDAGHRAGPRLHGARGAEPVGADRVRARRAHQVGEEKGKHIRLKAYSAHYNISFEMPRREQNAHRNIKKLALLLAHLLPIPLAIVATNRRSTGLGVRPRGNRLEITVRLHSRSRADDRHRQPRRGHRARGDRLALVRARRAGQAPHPAHRGRGAGQAHHAEGMAHQGFPVPGPEPLHHRPRRPRVADEVRRR